jgi:flagellar biosynthesis chaperone FliJ
MSAMKRLERLRVIQHEMSLRELADVDAQLDATKSAIADAAQAMMNRAAITDAASLVDADLQRRALDKRMAALHVTRAQRAEASRHNAIERKQVEMLVTRERERIYSERETAEARAMDELGAQLWSRT